MKKKFIFLFLLFLSSNYLFSQVHPYLPDAFSETYNPQKPDNKIQSVSITGNFTDLVIAVGFPDRSPTYPQITNNSSYPKLGVFRNGTLLSDYITQRGGSISLEEWYEPAFDTYFDTYSGGIYNVVLCQPCNVISNPDVVCRGEKSQLREFRDFSVAQNAPSKWQS